MHSSSIHRDISYHGEASCRSRTGEQAVLACDWALDGILRLVEFFRVEGHWQVHVLKINQPFAYVSSAEVPPDGKALISIFAQLPSPSVWHLELPPAFRRKSDTSTTLAAFCPKQPCIAHLIARQVHWTHKLCAKWAPSPRGWPQMYGMHSPGSPGSFNAS